MRLTKKTALIAIASLAVLGLCLWGGSLYLTRQNALKRFDESFIHYQAKSDDHQTFISQDINRKEVYNLSYSPTKETIAITKTIKKGDIYSSDYLYGPTTVYDIKQTADRYAIITSGHPILVDFGTTSVKVTYNKESFEIPYSELSFGESFPSEEN